MDQFQISEHHKSRISDSGAKHLATFLDSPQARGRMEILNLGLNSINDEGCGLLADVNKYMIFWFFFFKFRQIDFQIFNQAIGNNSTLHTLDLSSNMLTVSSGNHLRSMIMKSPALRELNVSCNKLAEDGGRKILEGISIQKSYNDDK